MNDWLEEKYEVSGMITKNRASEPYDYTEKRFRPQRSWGKQHKAIMAAIDCNARVNEWTFRHYACYSSDRDDIDNILSDNFRYRNKNFKRKYVTLKVVNNHDDTT